MPESQFDVESAAATLWAAWTSGVRMPELPSGSRPREAAEGVAVQEALAQHAGPSYGWKLAATSTAGQAHIGVDGPLTGPLFSRFRHADGDVLPSDAMHMRVAEVEFAFVMGADVAPDASVADVVDSVAAMHLAIEIPDSRFIDYAVVGGPQLIADCACASLFVVGPEVPGWRDVELSTWPTALWINGVEAARGVGAAVLGSPLTALAWAAQDLPRFGRRLAAGALVTTGTTMVPPAIGPGDVLRAEFGELGSVRATMAG